MKLPLDEHYADDIAAQLRSAGHDAVIVSERGLEDESLLALHLVARWGSAGEDHFGLLLTSDASIVEALAALMTANPDPRDLVNQVRWL